MPVAEYSPNVLVSSPSLLTQSNQPGSKLQPAPQHNMTSAAPVAMPVAVSLTTSDADVDLKRRGPDATWTLDWPSVCAHAVDALRRLSDGDLMPGTKEGRRGWVARLTTSPVTAKGRDALVRLFEGLATVFSKHPGCRLQLDWDFCDTYEVQCVCKPSPAVAAAVAQLNVPAQELKAWYGAERRDSRALDCTRLMFRACLSAACESVPAGAAGPLGGILEVHMCTECMSYDAVDKLPSW